MELNFLKEERPKVIIVPIDKTKRKNFLKTIEKEKKKNPNVIVEKFNIYNKKSFNTWIDRKDTEHKGFS